MFPLTPDQHHWLEVATEDEGWCSFTSCTPSRSRARTPQPTNDLVNIWAKRRSSGGTMATVFVHFHKNKFKFLCVTDKHNTKYKTLISEQPLYPCSVVNFHISGTKRASPRTSWVNSGTIPAILGRLATLDEVHIETGKQNRSFNFTMRHHRLSRCYINWSTLSKASNV